MKNNLFPLFALVLLSVISCTEGAITTSFDVNYSEMFTVPSGTIAAATVNDSTEALMLSADDFAANSSDIEKINGGKIKSCMLTIVNPVGEDFSFVENVSLSIQGEGLPKMVVASKSMIDSSATTIEMDLEDTDIVDHLKSNSFVLFATSVTDEDVNVDIDFEAAVVIAVTADVL